MIPSDSPHPLVINSVVAMGQHIAKIDVLLQTRDPSRQLFILQPQLPQGLADHLEPALHGVTEHGVDEELRLRYVSDGPLNEGQAFSSNLGFSLNAPFKPFRGAMNGFFQRQKSRLENRKVTGAISSMNFMSSITNIPGVHAKIFCGFFDGEFGVHCPQRQHCNIYISPC